jgi:hypothetical protein
LRRFEHSAAQVLFDGIDQCFGERSRQIDLEQTHKVCQAVKREVAAKLSPPPA